MISARGSPPARVRSTTASAIARTCIGDQARDDQPEAHAAQPEHGVLSCMRSTAASSSASCGRSVPGLAVATRTASSVRSGRNSCRGGSMRRIVTGRPSMAARMPVKSCRWSGSRASSAALALGLVLAPGSSPRPGLRRSPRNMCSVRHSPMPWAPKRRARAASSGVSALARTSSRRTASARSRVRATALDQRRRTARRSRRSASPAESISGSGAEVDGARGAVDGDRPCPRSTTVPSAAVKRRAPVSTASSSAPHTQTLPMPRATTAAWLVLPPRLVSTASAATMPGRSSGVVSWRTRTTFSPAAARRTASAESNTAAPTAAPGEAGTPCASGSPVGRGVEAGEHQPGELVPADPGQRLVLGDQPLVDQLGGDGERGLGGALADPGLQHPQRAALDGELDVAQVPVVASPGSACGRASCR